VILVVSEKEKDTSSTSGMETSKNTSELLASTVVDKRMKTIKQAYLEKDFETFGRITMADSNQFHATCLDTYPPIFYMNDTSHDIIRMVHVINNFYGKIVAAYTFDAGPNAVVYTLKEYIPMLLAVFSTYFPSTNDAKDYCNKPDMYVSAEKNRCSLVPKELLVACDKTGRKCSVGDVKYVFVTQPGPGPVQQPIEEALIDLTTGGYKAPSDKHKRLNIGSTSVAHTNATTSSKSNNSWVKSTPSACCLSTGNDCQIMGTIGLVIAVVAAVGYFYCKGHCRK